MSAATAEFARGRRLSRERLLWALLAISVALNLCVVAGVVWGRLNAPAPLTAAERFHRLEASLDLNDQQRAAFEAYSAATRARTLKLRQELEPLLDSAWSELGKPQPDEAAVVQRLGDASTRWTASQREGVDATLALLATLNPEQRAKFVADEREHRAAMRRRHAEEAR
jgi:Spy/CpxP family protein refolding chaperone